MNRPQSENRPLKNPRIGKKAMIIDGGIHYVVELKTHYINGDTKWMIMIPGKCLERGDNELYEPSARDCLEYEQGNHSRH